MLKGTGNMKIKWMPIQIDLESEPYANTVYFEPESAYKFYKELRGQELFLKCPAFIQSLKNTFVVKAPYDITLRFENGNIIAEGYDQKFFNQNIFTKHVKSFSSPPFMLEVMPRYVFVPDSNVSVSVSILQLILQPHQYGFMSGEFNITKWVRPVSYTFEVYDITKPIVFKRGDPLFMVKFTPEDGSVVTLEQAVLTEDITRLIYGCTSIKNFVPSLSLKAMYEMAKNYIRLTLKR